MYFSICTLEIPGAPVNVTIDTTTNTTAVVTWDAPVDTDGLPIDHYIVYQISYNTLQELVRTTDNSTSVTLQNLLPALSYTVTVAAVTRRLNRLFKGNLSDSENFTTMNGRKYKYCR